MTPIVIDACVWIAAVDPGDPERASSEELLTAVARLEIQIVVPTLARLEVGCALARRLDNQNTARALTDALFGARFIHQQPLDAALAERALELGISKRLRGADAVYAAIAEREAAQLVSLDRELNERAEALTPQEWLAAR